MKIIETLDYGYSLLDTGDILKQDGTIISADDYKTIQERINENATDWEDIETQEALAIIQKADWIAKTYEDNSDESIQKLGFAGFDSEGEPFYLRTSTFLGNESNQFAYTDYSKLIYHIRRNREDLIKDLQDYLEELFDTKDQKGTIYSPDNETTYLTKTFAKNGYIWKMIFRNGEISNIKKSAKIHKDMDANSGTGKGNAIANAIATKGFDNLR